MRVRMLGAAITFYMAASIGPAASQQASLSKGEVQAVEAGAKAKLRDPESARFGRYAAGKIAPNVVLVCGWVNSKNGYGGYAGFGPFLGYLFTEKPPHYQVRNVTTGELGFSFVNRSCAAEGVLLPSQP